MAKYSIAAKQPGNVVVKAESLADALQMAEDGRGRFEPDDGADVELDRNHVVKLRS